MYPKIHYRRKLLSQLLLQLLSVIMLLFICASKINRCQSDSFRISMRKFQYLEFWKNQNHILNQVLYSKNVLRSRVSILRNEDNFACLR